MPRSDLPRMPDPQGWIETHRPRKSLQRPLVIATPASSSSTTTFPALKMGRETPTQARLRQQQLPRDSLVSGSRGSSRRRLDTRHDKTPRTNSGRAKNTMQENDVKPIRPGSPLAASKARDFSFPREAVAVGAAKDINVSLHEMAQRRIRTASPRSPTRAPSKPRQRDCSPPTPPPHTSDVPLTPVPTQVLDKHKRLCGVDRVSPWKRPNRSITEKRSSVPHPRARDLPIQGDDADRTPRRRTDEETRCRPSGSKHHQVTPPKLRVPHETPDDRIVFGSPPPQPFHTDRHGSAKRSRSAFKPVTMEAETLLTWSVPPPPAVGIVEEVEDPPKYEQKHDDESLALSEATQPVPKLVVSSPPPAPSSSRERVEAPEVKRKRSGPSDLQFGILSIPTPPARESTSAGPALKRSRTCPALNENQSKLASFGFFASKTQSVNSREFDVAWADEPQLPFDPQDFEMRGTGHTDNAELRAIQDPPPHPALRPAGLRELRRLEAETQRSSAALDDQESELFSPPRDSIAYPPPLLTTSSLSTDTTSTEMGDIGESAMEWFVKLDQS